MSDDLRKVLQALIEGPDDVIPQSLRDRWPTLHWCVEWDYLPVADGCPEYECCKCGDDGKPFRGEQ